MVDVKFVFKKMAFTLNIVKNNENSLKIRI